ncbi:N-acetyltransferase family protein [Aerococcaceae bacterium DSM 111021]|nr:N-acetyltransferase family protein [Aerococcaceae bacterium DSM 111021]
MEFQSQQIFIRPAQINDAAHIQKIYTPYILNTVFNLEETVGTITYYQQTIIESMNHFPFLVAEYAGAVVGFVYVSEISFMLNLTNTCALSIYVSEDTPVRGVGQKLFTALELALSRQGITQVIANIVASNERSIRFHEKNGFQLLSTFPQAGYKFGQWHDVKWYGKKINTETPLTQTVPVENFSYSV